MPRIPATLVGKGPDGAEIFRPIIVVAIEVGPMGVRVPALVDSGADNTLVPFSRVDALGIKWDDLPEGYDGGGAGGGLKTRPCFGLVRWEAEKADLMHTFTVAEPDKGPDTVRSDGPTSSPSTCPAFTGTRAHLYSISIPSPSRIGDKALDSDRA